MLARQESELGLGWNPFMDNKQMEGSEQSREQEDYYSVSVVRCCRRGETESSAWTYVRTGCEGGGGDEQQLLVGDAGAALLPPVHGAAGAPVVVHLISSCGRRLLHFDRLRPVRRRRPMRGLLSRGGGIARGGDRQQQDSQEKKEAGGGWRERKEEEEVERRGRKERNVEEGRWPQAAASPRRPLGTLVGVPVHLIDGSSSSFLPQAGASSHGPWTEDDDKNCCKR